MHRRQVLQVGAALATLPLAGCGAGTPESKPAPVDTKEAKAKAEVPVDDQATKAVEKDTGAPPGDDAAAKTEPAKEEAPKSPFSRVVSKVGRNHGHVLTVSFADVAAGAEKTYELAGTAGHPHTVTLSPDEMKRLLDGQIVRTKSSQDRAHAHRLLVRCAPPVDPPEWVSACTVTINTKDEHELIVPAADLDAKVEKTYDIQGIAGHAHQVTITAADFQKLTTPASVKLISTRGDAHTHVVVLYRTPHAKA